MSDTETAREWGRREIESPEERIEELEKQVAELTEQLESQVETLTDRLEEHRKSGSVTRRQTLGMLGGGALLGSSALLGGSGTARAASKNEPTGGEAAKGGWLNEVTLQTSMDGMVVPVAPGLDASDAIDPEKTDTPVQDAMDAVADAGGKVESGGKVLLPPEPVEEKTTIDLINGAFT